MSGLMRMQAPQGTPRSPIFSVVTDPIIPPKNVSRMLDHFPDEVYDKNPESVLMRLLKVMLGDLGAGRVRKQSTYEHLSRWLYTAQFGDLDRYLSGATGVRRRRDEMVGVDGLSATLLADEWERVISADSSYRDRLAAAMFALPWGGTTTGMELMASAVLGHPCRVYETDEFISLGIDPPYLSRLEHGARKEFVVRPLRETTQEEKRLVERALDKIKPVDTLLTFDLSALADGPQTEVGIVDAHSPSEYWHVRSTVLVTPDTAESYANVDEREAVEQPRYYGSHYQGEAWDYTGDIAEIRAFAEATPETPINGLNVARVDFPDGTRVEYSPEFGLTPHQSTSRGRAVSDGVLSAPVTTRGA